MSIENIVSIVLILAFIGVFLFGMLAARQIDPSKTGSLSKNDMVFFGPMVSEKVLTAKGLKWARLRNYCFLILFFLAILFAIIKGGHP
jgi:hypothetical protein